MSAPNQYERKTFPILFLVAAVLVPPCLTELGIIITNEWIVGAIPGVALGVVFLALAAWTYFKPGKPHA